MLIGEAAKAKGLSPDQFSEAEIKRRVNPVTEGQIVSFFQQNQGQMQGRDLAAMNPAIRRYLEEQERSAAYRALVTSCARQGLEWIRSSMHRVHRRD